MRQLDRNLPEAELDRLLKILLQRCAEASYANGHQSIESQFQSVSELAGVLRHNGRDIVQIDKLARYWSLCKDLSRMPRRRSYRHLLKNVRFEALRHFPSARPPTAVRNCFVHAEVQLILQIEKQQLEKPPRAIGCSKSACFLCDSLIRNIGKYSISLSHGRLYNQWYIPDVDWMTPAQVAQFQKIVKFMTQEMSLLASNQATSRFRPWALESRPPRPLPSGSSISEFSLLSKPSLKLSSISALSSRTVLAVSSHRRGDEPTVSHSSERRRSQPLTLSEQSLVIPSEHLLKICV
jgi:hypothetical protein